MSGHDIEDLAKGLNSSERWIIQHMTDEPKPYVSVRGQPRVSLFRKGLLTCAIERPVPMMALTTMGLAVRTYLHRNPTPKGLSS